MENKRLTIKCERCHTTFLQWDMVMVRRNNVWWTVCTDCGQILLTEEQQEHEGTGTVQDS